MQTPDPFEYLFFNESKDPKQYYFVSKNGRRTYYLTRNNKKIAMSRIPICVLGKIEKRDAYDLNNIKNKREYDTLMKKINKVEEHLKNLREKADDIKKETNFEKANEEENKRENANKKYKKETKSDYNTFFEEKYKRFNFDTSNILQYNNIYTKKQLRLWLIKNHPDKGGKDTDLCSMIIEAGKKMKWL